MKSSLTLFVIKSYQAMVQQALGINPLSIPMRVSQQMKTSQNLQTAVQLLSGHLAVTPLAAVAVIVVGNLGLANVTGQDRRRDLGGVGRVLGNSR